MHYGLRKSLLPIKMQKKQSLFKIDESFEEIDPEHCKILQLSSSEKLFLFRYPKNVVVCFIKTVLYLRVLYHILFRWIYEA